MWDDRYIRELNLRRGQIRAAGGKQRIQKQHEKGKLTARERIEYLFDKGSFSEIGSMVESRVSDLGMDEKRQAGDGVITGVGTVNGALVYVSSEDFTVMGGTLGEYHAMKICRVMDMALQMRAPFVSINDSGGARIEEGILALNGYGQIFYRHTKASGVIPQIAAIMGPCAGGACYAPAICDHVFMTEKSSRMFITGPGVIRSVVGESVSEEEFGGAKMHMEGSGVAHFVYPDDEECLEGIKKLLSYFTGSVEKKRFPKIGGWKDHSFRLQEIVPDRQRQVYDVHEVIDTFIDEGSFLEVQKDYAKNIVIGYARIDLEVLGIVASQPQSMGGALDINASEKAARFVRTCDCFRIPILTLVDVPGFLPGLDQETNGIIRRGAKLLYAYAEASVPKVALIMRKAYGGAYIALNSKGMGADIVYAWPIAQIAVMGAEGAVDVIFRRQIGQAEDKENVRQNLIQQYEEKFMSPYMAASLGHIDEVIAPEETGEKIKAAFRMLRLKQSDDFCERHGNIPL